MTSETISAAAPTGSLSPAQMLYTLKTRRSIGLKELSPDPIPREWVETLLEAANWAPSHKHTEPWRFTVFTGDGRKKLHALFANAYRLSTPADKFSDEGLRAASDRVWQAPVWLSIGMQPNVELDLPEWEDIIATGIAVHNLQLMAVSLGLGSKWSSSTISTHESVADYLGLQAPARLFGFMYIGNPRGEPLTGKRKPLDAKVKWVEDV